MTKEKTIMQALTEVVPNYLASYLCWYYSDPNKRISWEELCKSDANFRSKSGENKTEDFAEQNWLIRDDVQKAMIIYLQYMKRYNFMKRYQEMNKKALSGDVNSAKYVDEMDKILDKMSVDKNTESEIDRLLEGVTINGTVIIESTTKGFNLFSTTYMQARNGENDFKPFFFNFINGSSLFIPQYKLAVKSWKARHNGKMLTEDEYDEEEKSLAKLGMTPEQAVWRRGKISESSLDAFHEEFPSTFEESCIVSGSSVFDNNKVIRLQQAIVQQNIKPLSLDKIVGIPQVLRPHVSNRNLKVWQIPKKGIRYVLGCDVAEGLGGKRDSSTIYVSDKDGVQVAQFKSNKVKPYEFADIIDAMGRWYNKGLLVVEKASGGHSCIERLRYDKKYMNMYKYKCYDEFKRTIWKVGFDTNNKTKSIAVNDMREWFDKGLIDIQSNDLLEEMKTFVAEDNGAFNAVVGSHDDLVSACWLCIAGMKSAFWYPF